MDVNANSLLEDKVSDDKMSNMKSPEVTIILDSGISLFNC